MATSLNLRTGARYEVTLMGSQRWVRAARVMSVLPDVVVLQLDDGQQLTVPQTAVISARPLANQAAGNDRPRPDGRPAPDGARGYRESPGQCRVLLLRVYQ